MGKKVREASRGGRLRWAANSLVQVSTAVLALVLSGCGGGGGAKPGDSGAAPVVVVAQEPPPSPAEVPASIPVPPPANPPQVPLKSGSLQASQPGELLAYVKAKLLERQRLREQNASNNVDFSPSRGAGTVSSGGFVISAGSASLPTERSSTVVQEFGVDEDDVIKSDGNFIYTLGAETGPGSGGLGQPVARVSLNRRLSDGRTERASQISLHADASMFGSYSGMYLASNQARLAVLGSMWEGARFVIMGAPEKNKLTVAVDVVNAVDASRPVVTDKMRIDGRLVGSRLIGNALVLVTQFAPRLAVDALPWNASATEREAAMAKLTTADLLPTIKVNNGPSQALMAETDCFVEPKNASYGLEITSITIIDLTSASPTHSSRCFIGGSEALYVSTTSLFLATTSYAIQPLAPSSSYGRLVFPPNITTDIHKFSFTQGNEGAVVAVDYRGSGSVPGHLGWSDQQRSFRMSEQNGDLRVLTFTGTSGWGGLSDAIAQAGPVPSPATLTVLRETSSGKSLQQIGQLPNKERPQPIGKPGEQVYAVRFIGDRGYVVTFRRVDPLYVIDLSKPSDPKTTGELTVAGFSDYLFPVGPSGSGLLLGVGKDSSGGVDFGVKVALFDVADPSNPTQKSTFTIKGGESRSALDFSRHGIDLFTRGSTTRVVLPTRVLLSSSMMNLYPSIELQRFEVDATTRSMKLMEPLAQTYTYRELGQERTLQIGEMVHHFAPSLSVDAVASYAW